MSRNPLVKKVSLVVVAAASLYGAYFAYTKYEEYKVNLQRAIEDAEEGKKIMSQDHSDDSHWKEIFPESTNTFYLIFFWLATLGEHKKNWVKLTCEFAK